MKAVVIGWIVVVAMVFVLYCANIYGVMSSDRKMAEWRPADVICVAGILVAPVGVICGAVHSF